VDTKTIDKKGKILQSAKHSKLITKPGTAFLLIASNPPFSGILSAGDEQMGWLCHSHHDKVGELQFTLRSFEQKFRHTSVKGSCARHVAAQSSR
jgi:hypothetical protein